MPAMPRHQLPDAQERLVGKGQLAQIGGYEEGIQELGHW